MNLIVAPNGVALSEEIQQQSQNTPLLWTLAGVAGELMRTRMPDLSQPTKVDVQVARSDDVAIVWAVGPWVLHASDLRAGTLSMFCEMVRKSRAKGALAAQMGMSRGPMVVPRNVMSLLARSEGIPVGIIVQTTTDPVPLPMIEVRLSGDMQSMWLASVYCNLVARLGEPALRAALATIAKLRAAYPDPDAILDHAPGAMMQHQIVEDEAVACLVLEQWHRERGTAELAALHAMVAP